jgi:hypothetical protein
MNRKNLSEEDMYEPVDETAIIISLNLMGQQRALGPDILTCNGVPTVLRLGK